MVIMARTLNWIPDTLYNYSLSKVALHYHVFEKDLKLFQCSILFDVYLQLYKNGELEKLANELKEPDLFAKLLKVTEKRSQLHNAFQVLMDSGYPVANYLACNFRNHCIEIEVGCELKTIQLGFTIGSFLVDAGWYPESEIIFLACRELCQRNTQTVGWSIIFECLKRLLKVRTLYCKFQEAETTVQDALNCIELAERLGLKINFAGVYGEISALYFIQSRSDEAYKWCQKALQSLDSSVPFRELISVYCYASKACLMKKYFKKSELLIKQALSKTKAVVGFPNLLMAEVLMDYGYYLLHIDSTRHSITVYQEVLNILTRILGGHNLRIAAAHEDIAYACYVNEYKTGDFKEATEHIEKANFIKEKLLEEDHFLLPSAKRMTVQ